MNTYTWNIESLDVATSQDGLANVVKSASYWVEAVSDDGLKAQHHGRVAFSSPNPDAFKEYAFLTEEDVLGWVRGSFGDDPIVEHKLDAKIDELRSPAVVQKDLPWA